jgi:putative endonuclease
MNVPSDSLRNKRYRRGLRAEKIAIWALRAQGWRIVANRFKTPLGEIDVIARRGKQLRFVEVKARRSLHDAAEAIHKENQQRVVRAAQWFLTTQPNYLNYTVRFDACLVPWYYWPKFISHAFGASL